MQGIEKPLQKDYPCVVALVEDSV